MQHILQLWPVGNEISTKFCAYAVYLFYTVIGPTKSRVHSVVVLSVSLISFNCTNVLDSIQLCYITFHKFLLLFNANFSLSSIAFLACCQFLNVLQTLHMCIIITEQYILNITVTIDLLLPYIS